MTLSLGYKLASEEHSASDLVRNAQMAEDTGFSFARNRARGGSAPASFRRLARDLPAGAPARPRPGRPTANPRADASQGESHGFSDDPLVRRS